MSRFSVLRRQLDADDTERNHALENPGRVRPRLRRLKVERRAYQGPWLPQPVSTEEDVTEKSAMIAEELGFGFLLMLEKLSAAERVVSVLRKAVGTSFAEITSSSEQKRLLERMIATVSVGDAEGLVALMANDAVLLAHSCLLVEAREGLIRRIYVVRNPLKLGHLAVSSRISQGTSD